MSFPFLFRYAICANQPKCYYRMAVCLDGKKVCICLPLTGLLLCCLYSILLKEPKTRFASRDFKGGDDLFEVNSYVNNSMSLEYDDPARRLSSSAIGKNTEQWNERVSKGRSKHIEQKRLPNAIIIGVKKGGTRALLEFLKIHPKIKACPWEVHFFDTDKNYELGLDWYREQMPESYKGDITVEKTPAYFVRDKVPQRVYRMSKSVKLIAIVRNPVERAISDYVQVTHRRHGVLPPFERYVTNDKTGKVLRTSIGLIRIGVYVKHLRNWLKYFPISQLHFVNGDDLITNPAKELQAVEKFLNIEPFIKKENFYINQTKRFPCISRSFKLKKENSGCLSESKGRPHPSIRSDIRKLLEDYFRPYNEEFYKEVGRDFHW